MKLDETSQAYVKNLRGEASRWYEIFNDDINTLFENYKTEKSRVQQ